MRSLIFEEKTWLIYMQLREKDKKLHKALCKRLKEMLRTNPTGGLGKPEPLKHNLSELWSKRISQKDRLIYNFDDDYIYLCHWGTLRRPLEKILTLFRLADSLIDTPLLFATFKFKQIV